MSGGMRFSRLGVALVAIALLPAVLTGCSLPGGGGQTGDNGAATSGPAPDESTGTDDATDGEFTIPATFPADEVPLIEGDVAYSQDLGTGWVVYIHRDDFLGGYDEAKGLLTGAGFSGDTVNQDDTQAFGQFTTDKYTVNLTAGDGADLGVGPSVAYTVVVN
ncbi:MAG: hypothetical protein ABIQ01_07470 [Pseudolysinimonas sp.]